MLYNKPRNCISFPFCCTELVAATLMFHGAVSNLASVEKLAQHGGQYLRSENSQIK